MNKDKKSLYRKVNSKAAHCRHNIGPDARHTRNTKKGLTSKMVKRERGLDFTPLYMFLIKNVGKVWDNVYSEAVSRLEGNEHAVWHLVDYPNEPKTNYNIGPLSFVRCSESSLYSKLFIDNNGILQKVSPELSNEMIYPTCPCCTHTFNGKVLINKFNDKSMYNNMKLVINNDVSA